MPTASSSTAPTESARVWTVYASFASALVLIMAGAGGTHLLLHPRLGPVMALIGALIVTALVLIGCATVGAVLSPAPWLPRLGLRPITVGPLVLFAAALGAPALGALLDAITALLEVELTGSLLFFAQLVRNADASELVWLSLALSIGPGIGEELLFRGYIQTRLVERHGARSGILITSALFGLMHFDPLQSVLAGLLGIYLGYLAVRFSSIVPSICAHALNNFIATISTAYLPDAHAGLNESLVLAGAGFACFSACLFTVQRAPRAVGARSGESESPPLR